MAPETAPRWRTTAGFAHVGGTWTSVFLTLTLLAAIGLEVRNREQPGDPTGYHERIRDAAKATMPYSVGDWLGKDVETPASAVEMLHPNVIANRTYVNSATGETASLLFVQCSDARDLLGHYPPVCYVAHGMSLISAVPRDWTVGSEQVQGMRYRFGGKSLGAATETVVDNFMILPTGAFGRDMESMGQVAKDRRTRMYGAAQLQVLTDGAMSDSRRDEVLRSLVEPIIPLIECVGVVGVKGVKKGQQRE